jgi:hypothetical protein
MWNIPLWEEIVFIAGLLIIVISSSLSMCLLLGDIEKIMKRFKFVNPNIPFLVFSGITFLTGLTLNLLPHASELFEWMKFLSRLSGTSIF